MSDGDEGHDLAANVCIDRSAQASCIHDHHCGCWVRSLRSHHCPLHAKNPQPKPEVPYLPTLRKVGNGYNTTKSPPSSWVLLMTHRAKVPIPALL